MSYEITMKGTFSLEEMEILSKMKGYSPTIPNGPGQDEIENPQTREDFIRQVYERMVKEDAVTLFLAYSKQQRAEAELLEEETIRANVEKSITSFVGEL